MLRLTIGAALAALLATGCDSEASSGEAFPEEAGDDVAGGKTDAAVPSPEGVQYNCSSTEHTISLTVGERVEVNVYAVQIEWSPVGSFADPKNLQSTLWVTHTVLDDPDADPEGVPAAELVTSAYYDDTHELRVELLESDRPGPDVTGTLYLGDSAPELLECGRT